MTSLKELRELGGLVSEKPIKKDIKFKVEEDEITAVVHVVRLGIGDYEKAVESKEGDRSHMAHIISSFVRLGDNGAEKISYTDAYRLTPSLGGAMVQAFNEVNAAKKT